MRALWWCPRCSLKSISPSTKLFRIKAGCTYLFNPSRCLESNDTYIDVYFGLCHSDCDGEKNWTADGVWSRMDGCGWMSYVVKKVEAKYDTWTVCNYAKYGACAVYGPWNVQWALAQFWSLNIVSALWFGALQQWVWCSRCAVSDRCTKYGTAVVQLVWYSGTVE